MLIKPTSYYYYSRSTHWVTYFYLRMNYFSAEKSGQNGQLRCHRSEQFELRKKNSKHMKGKIPCNQQWVEENRMHYKTRQMAELERNSIVNAHKMHWIVSSCCCFFLHHYLARLNGTLHTKCIYEYCVCNILFTYVTENQSHGYVHELKCANALRKKQEGEKYEYVVQYELGPYSLQQICVSVLLALLLLINYTSSHVRVRMLFVQLENYTLSNL